MAIARGLPTFNADSTTANSPSRTDSYLGAWTTPLWGGNQGSAYEGSYYHVSNATLATGIAGHAAPVVADADTKPLFFIFNGSTKYLVMDYLFLEVTAAGTGGTIQYTTIYIDQAGASSRTGAGTAITPVNALSGGASATGVGCWFGAVTAVMTSSVKVGQQINREVIPVVQDTLLMKFGGSSATMHSALTTAGTATNHTVQQFGPIVLSPGGNLNISQIRPSQSAAASYQFDGGFTLR